MAKQRNPKAVNIDNAGEQDVEQALDNADEPTTQAAVSDFQSAIENEVSDAQPNVNEANWDEVVEQARETETEYEESGSRADAYDGEAWEAVPEDERPPDAQIDEDQEDQAGQQKNNQEQRVSQAESVDLLDREETLRNRIRDGHEEATLENVPVEEIKEIQSDTAQSQLGGMLAQAENVTGDPSAGAALASDDHLFDDPEAAVVGEEQISLPDDKQIDGGDGLPDDPLPDSIPREEITGIDFDDIDAPEASDVADSELDTETGYHEMVERIAGQQAELELQNRDAALRADAGESPNRASQIAVQQEDSQEQRSWVTTVEEDTSSDHLYRFVGRSPDTPSSAREAKSDVYQSLEVRKEIAIAQNEVKATGEFTHTEAKSKGVTPSYDSQYDSVYEALADGEEILDSSMDPAPSAAPLTADRLDEVGATAALRLQEAGYTHVNDLRNATVDDLTSVNGVGEKKAERLLETQGEVAQRITAEAARVNMELGDTARGFGQEEFERIIEYGAKNGVPAEKMGNVIRDPDMQKEMPGPTPVSALESGDTETRRQINRNADTQYLSGHETQSGTTHRVTNPTTNGQAPPVRVSATVERAYTPNNPSAERQVVKISDHNGNETKLTIYRDSLIESEPETTAGQFKDGNTHPENGVDPNIVLKAGDEIEITNPQVNDYGGGESDNWDGPTLATTPGTTIDTGGESLRRPSEGVVSDEMISRGVTDYGPDRDGADRPRWMNRRIRQYQEQHGNTTDAFNDKVETDGVEQRDVDADI